MPKRARRAAGEISIRGADGQFRQKSWKEISPELSSSSADSGVRVPATGAAQPPSAGSVTTHSQRQGHEGEPINTGAACEDEHGGGVEETGEPSTQEEQQPSALDIYVHQILSIHWECVPPLVPSGLKRAAQQGESTFCLPGFDEKKGSLTYDSFAMPGPRRVPLSDGGFGVAYWCTCCSELELQKRMFSGLSNGQQGKASLDDQAPQCLHLQAVLKLGGAVNLDAISLCLLPERGPEEGTDDEHAAERLLVLPFRGVFTPKAILVGTAASGCVVVVEKTLGRWKCTQCFWQGKAEVLACSGSHGFAEGGVGGFSKFEEQLKGDFDRSIGKRTLKCLSHASIPKEHVADPALAERLLRRGGGELAFPT